MSDFYRTNMGHRFYEGTMPSLVTQLKRLNDNLELMLKLAEEAKVKAKDDTQPEGDKS